MALTINPAVSGDRNRWIVDSLTFFVGAALGALASVMVIVGSVGAISLIVQRKWLLWMTMPVGVVAILRELGFHVPVPYRSQQVPEWWRSAMPLRPVSLAYGAALGFGFATPFASSAHAVTLLAVPFLESVWAMLGVALLIATGKTLVLYLGHGTHTHEDVLARLTVAEATSARRWVRRATSAGASLMVLVALVESSGSLHS